MVQRQKPDPDLFPLLYHIFINTKSRKKNILKREYQGSFLRKGLREHYYNIPVIMLFLIRIEWMCGRPFLVDLGAYYY
jgi:hypothetical protein